MFIPFLCLGAFMVLWFTFFLYAGPDLAQSLGGALEFYFLLPIIASLPLKYKNFSSLLWSVVLALSSLISVNHLYWASSGGFQGCHPLLRMFLVIIPLMMIVFGFVGATMSFLSPRTAESEPAFRLFSRLVCFLWLVPLTAMGLVMIVPEDIYPGSILQVTYQAGLGGLVLAELVFVMKLRRIGAERLTCIVKPSLRLPLDPSKFRKNVIFGTGVVVFFSFSAEHLRKSWVVWAESTAFFLLLAVAIFEFFKSLDMKIPRVSEQPCQIALPGMSTRTFMLLYLIAVTLLMAAGVFLAIYFPGS